MTNYFLSFILVFFSLSTFAQSKTDLVVNHMLRGTIYVQSSIEDTTAAGGFGRSENFAKSIADSLNFIETGFFLKIDTAKVITIADKFNGYKFYIVNKNDTVVKLDASDSRLYVVAEVYYKNKWQPIEYLPSSLCGNSYYTVYLKPNEYWEFQIPKFSGKISSKLRYRLSIGKDKYVYSNEILTSINKRQLTEKKDKMQ